MTKRPKSRNSKPTSSSTSLPSRSPNSATTAEEEISIDLDNNNNNTNIDPSLLPSFESEIITTNSSNGSSTSNNNGISTTTSASERITGLKLELTDEFLKALTADHHEPSGSSTLGGGGGGGGVLNDGRYNRQGLVGGEEEELAETQIEGEGEEEGGDISMDSIVPIHGEEEDLEEGMEVVEQEHQHLEQGDEELEEVKPKPISKRPNKGGRTSSSSTTTTNNKPNSKSKPTSSNSNTTSTPRNGPGRQPNSTSSTKSTNGNGKGKGKEVISKQDHRRKTSPKVELSREGGGEEEEEIDIPEEVIEFVQKRSMRGRTGKKVVVPLLEEEVFEDEEEGGDGVTRCVCGEDTEEMSSGLMIECDTCKCWQHGPCVGLWGEKDCPDRYFCELCRPGWHGPGGILRKAHRKTSTAPPHPAPIASTSTSTLNQRKPPSTPNLSSTATTTSAPVGRPSNASNSRNKPRESADAALIASAFLGNDSVMEEQEEGEVSTSLPSLPSSHSNQTTPHHNNSSNLLPSGLGLSSSSSLTVDGASFKAPKKRSTMNSRDAAYDDAIALSILEPGSAAMRAKFEKKDEEEDEIEGAGVGGGERKRRSSRSGDFEGKIDLENVSLPPLPPLPSSTTTTTTTSTTTGGKGGAGSKRRKVSIDTSNQHLPPTLNIVEPIEEMNGGMDGGEGLLEEEYDEDHNDHSTTKTKHANQYTYRPKSSSSHPHPPSTSLSHPSTTSTSRNTRPSPIKRSAPFLAPLDHVLRAPKEKRDWTAQEAAGWGLPDHLKHLKHLLPSSTPLPILVPVFNRVLVDSTEGEGEKYKIETISSISETPTRIKFPNKRMTMPEMKKRSRNVLDYLGRIQLELSEREKIGTTGAGIGGEEYKNEGEEDSLKLMDELTKDVILFQKRFFGE